MKTSLQPLDCVPLFPIMRAELLRVLHYLEDHEWKQPTACAGWSVRDVALHILADDIGYLSRHRDQDGIQFPSDDWDELVRLINQQNDLWVKATRRMSRRILLQLLETFGAEMHAFLQTIEADALTHPVSWASSQPAPQWLQIAREMTEYWMHHQHICEAIGVISLKNAGFLKPVIATFVHALPRAYAQLDAPPDTVVQVRIESEDWVERWYVIRDSADHWGLYAHTDLPIQASIACSAHIAWHLFTRGIDPKVAREQSGITGDTDLTAPFFQTIAIIA